MDVSPHDRLSHRVILGFLVVFIVFNLYEFYGHIEQLPTYTYYSFVTIPATNGPTLVPTTFAPSSSPTFFDYINRVFYFNRSVIGAELGPHHETADKLCSSMVDGAVAVLYYTNRSIQSLSRKPNCSVVMDDTIIAHDWLGFQQDRLLFTEPFWIGEEFVNCADWTHPNDIGLIYDDQTRQCSLHARLLCLTLVKL
jgi:hypothetical protein